MSQKRRFLLFLIPTIGRALLSFIVLPFTTYKLGPADFGLYALATSVSGIGAAIACAGSGYALAADFPKGSGVVRKSLVSSLFFCSMLVGTLLALVLLASLLLWGDLTGFALSSPLIALIALIGVVQIPWTYGVQIVTLDAKPDQYAVIQLGEALISSASTLIALYVFSLGVEALFVGAFAGSVFTAAGGLWVMRVYLGAYMDFSSLRANGVVWGLSVFSIMAEKAQDLVERSVVSFALGLEQLGIYSHSQQYRNVVSMGVKSASYSLWPVTLEEARQIEPVFPKTEASWNLVAMIVTAAGIFFSIFGELLIGKLTHGKFSSAYVLASFWMVFILIQNTGKSQIAFLYARSHGASNQVVIMLSILVAVLIMFFLAPKFGLAGVVASVFLQVVTYRLALLFLAKKKSALPFLDGRILGGACIISASLYFSVFYPNVEWRALNLALSILGLILVFFPQLRSLVVVFSKLRKEQKQFFC